MVLTTVLSMIRYVSGTNDRDFVDRLHSYFTTNILIGLSVLVSFKQFGGTPIECLTPDVFSGSWEEVNSVFTSNALIVLALIGSYKQFGGHPIECLTPDLPFVGADEYAENYCWAQDTYSVLMDEIVDGMSRHERQQRRISYYQWVPFFLLITAACFRLPSILWKYMSGHSGIKIQEIVKLSSDPNNIKPDIKRANIRSLTVHLQGALRFHRRLNKKQIRPHRLLRLFNLPYSACFVTVMYMITKFCYLMNVFFQLLLMNKFLETDKYKFYGLGAIVDMLNGKTWETSGVFPRVSLCDFQVRVMGNIQEHTIQCVLVINIFNEKIFIFLWFWFVFLLIFTAGSFLYWMALFVVPFPNRRFIKRHLEMSELTFDPDENDKAVERFIDSYLRSDGIFVIRMLTLHSGVIFGTDLVQELWKSYYGIEENIKRSNSNPNISGYPMGLEDQNDFENTKNFLRQRRRNDMYKPNSRRGSRDAHERLITPPLPPQAVLKALQQAVKPNSINSSTGSSPGTNATLTVSDSNLPYRPPTFVEGDGYSTNNNHLPDSTHSTPVKLNETIPEEDEEVKTNATQRQQSPREYTMTREALEARPALVQRSHKPDSTYVKIQ
ncbi:Innexin [Aphelenchoides besseyi]|nr:Innexin [Aphelenchoides besseyi]